MTKTIAIVNQKGGVGKSVTTASLGIGLAKRGKKVLIVDADPQASLTDSLGYKHPDELAPTLCTLMEKNMNDTPLLPGEGILHRTRALILFPQTSNLPGWKLPWSMDRAVKRCCVPA
jgi:chromosome partitioning protein